jgi:metallo-beta-lactamase class B
VRPVLCVLLVALAACAGTRLAPPTPPPAGFVVRDVAPGAVVLTEPQPWQANMLLVEMPDRSLVLVNAPATEASTRTLLGWIGARYGARRLVVVNSHFHADAMGGNAVLHDAGAETIGSRDTAARIVDRGPSMRDSLVREHRTTQPAFADAMAATRFVPPARLFDPAEGLVLRFGPEEVRIIHPGPAHSPDNVVVFFPSRRILFGGCMVKGGDSIGYLGDADTARWPAAIRALQALSPEVVVPGHEGRLDPGQLDRTLELLANAS